MAKKVSITVLINDYYDAIRGLVAPDVTLAHISNQYLSQLPFVPAAERKVRQRLAADGIDVDTLTGEAREDAILAMMHECVAVLCLTAPQLLRQTELQVSTEVQRIDWKEKREFHLAEAGSKISDVKEKFGKDGTTSTGQPGTIGAGRNRLSPFGAVGTKRRDDEAVCPISRRM